MDEPPSSLPSPAPAPIAPGVPPRRPGGAWSVRAARDVRLGVKNLLLHKLRSFLAMLGLVFGVGSVIAMLAIGEGASAEAIAQIRRLGSRNILLRAAKPAADQNSNSGRAFLSVYGCSTTTPSASPRRSPASSASWP